jgi:NAD(P)-dependent dehydrogenase (short-subunit alcohol dehydrogenase family)
VEGLRDALYEQLKIHSVGIGYSTVKFLARRGAKVYLAARNESKGTKAAANLELEGQESGGKVVFLKLDLADPRMAKESAQEFLSKETRLDILSRCVPRCGCATRNVHNHSVSVNNAGL